MNLLAFIKHQMFHIVFQHSEKKPTQMNTKIFLFELCSRSEVFAVDIREDEFSPQKSRDFSPSSTLIEVINDTIIALLFIFTALRRIIVNIFVKSISSKNS